MEIKVKPKNSVNRIGKYSDPIENGVAVTLNEKPKDVATCKPEVWEMPFKRFLPWDTRKIDSNTPFVTRT